MQQIKNPKRPIRVGLGSDIGAGTRFSLLETMGDAYKVSALTAYPLDAAKLFYLATRGGAEILGIADYVGSIEIGKEADLVVLDTHATPLLSYRSQQADSLLGDDRAVRATYIGGELAYSRPSQQGVSFEE